MFSPLLWVTCCCWWTLCSWNIPGMNRIRVKTPAPALAHLKPVKFTNQENLFNFCSVRWIETIRIDYVFGWWLLLGLKLVKLWEGQFSECLSCFFLALVLVSSQASVLSQVMKLNFISKPSLKSTLPFVGLQHMQECQAVWYFS